MLLDLDNVDSMLRNIVTIIFLFTLIGCQSMYKGADNGSDIGVWEGRVDIRDAKRDKKMWGNIVWVSESKRDRLRIDVTAAFDTPIATFIMEGQNAFLWLYRERKYYKSDNPPKLFARLTKISLDPKIFYALLGKGSRLGSPWKCSEEPARTNCSNTEQKISLSMDQILADNERKFNIKKGSKSLVIKLVRSKVEVKDKMFKHRSTSRFEKHTI